MSMDVGQWARSDILLVHDVKQRNENRYAWQARNYSKFVETRKLPRIAVVAIDGHYCCDQNRVLLHAQVLIL